MFRVLRGPSHPPAASAGLAVLIWRAVGRLGVKPRRAGAGFGRHADDGELVAAGAIEQHAVAHPHRIPYEITRLVVAPAYLAYRCAVRCQRNVHQAFGQHLPSPDFISP